MSSASKLATCIWFDTQAEEAARFYVSLLPDSSIDHVSRSGVDWPAGKAGDVVLVEFTLGGARCQALNGGPSVQHNEAMSLSVSCDDQAEVDRLWQALLADGGSEIMCGWLKDRYGVHWQIVPARLQEMLRDENTERQARVTSAMFSMVKLDLEALERAYEG